MLTVFLVYDIKEYLKECNNIFQLKYISILLWPCRVSHLHVRILSKEKLSLQ